MPVPPLDVSRPADLQLDMNAPPKDKAAPPPLASRATGSSASLEMSPRYQAQQASGKGPQVGKPVTQNKFCSECGAQLGVGKFCAECGAPRA